MSDKINCSSKEWQKFDVEGEILSIDDKELIALRNQVWAIHGTLGITYLKLVTENNIVKVDLKLVDDRRWQETHFDQTLDPPTSFNITGEWKPSEFLNIRSLRSILTNLITRGMTNLDIRPRI